MKKQVVIYSVLVIGLLWSCSKTDSENCTAVDNPDCICTMEYAPVCGCDDITYSNSCAAGCHGIDVKSQGECPE